MSAVGMATFCYLRSVRAGRRWAWSQTRKRSRSPARGLTVHLGGLETLASEREAFDGMTLNHVIEHVHNPRATLADCYRLLKPGGWLWLETPNLDAQGHALPRELGRAGHPAPSGGLHDRALLRLLQEVGFARVERLPYYPLCERVYAMSRVIAIGASPHQPPPLPSEERLLAQQAEVDARRRPEIREFIMVRAWKTEPTYPDCYRAAPSTLKGRRIRVLIRQPTDTRLEVDAHAPPCRRLLCTQRRDNHRQASFPVRLLGRRIAQVDNIHRLQHSRQDYFHLFVAPVCLTVAFDSIVIQVCNQRFMSFQIRR